MINIDYIARNSPVGKIQPFVDKQVIKVVTGQRRVGKSYVLKQLRDQFKGQVIFIDKERYEFDFIKSYKELVEYVEEIAQEERVGLFIDEIQEIEAFEKALRHFQSVGKYDIYCTGSNAKLLSGELATLLSGRYVQFEIHALSFAEFQRFHAEVNFDDYLIFGGMPYLKNLPLKKEIAYQYLRSVYEGIVLKDVVERYTLRNVKFLENLVIYLCNNLGSITSASNIVKSLKSQHVKISLATLISYVEALKNCFFIYEVPRYDIEGKRVFEINHKYYVEDIGIRNSIVGYNQSRDEAKVLENIIFMALKRHGFNVHVGIIGDLEVDFVAEKANEKIYVQVALNVENESTFKREFGNLQRIQDNYLKYVVTKYATSINTVEGIRHLSVEAFLDLLEKDEGF